MSNGLVKNNPVNDPDSKPVKGHSVFKPSMSLYSTMLFGLVNPGHAMEVVPDDRRVSIRCNTDLDTLSLKAPFMTALRMHRDYFYVPLRAILPRMADLLITNPRTGDDINAAAVQPLLLLNTDPVLHGIYDANDQGSIPSNYTLGQFLNYVVGTFNTIQANATADASHYFARLLNALSTYQLLDPLVSRASLLNQFGIATSELVTSKNVYSSNLYYKYMSFDKLFESIFSQIRRNVELFQVKFADMAVPSTDSGTYSGSNLSYTVMVDGFDASTPVSNSFISFRQFLELLREQPLASVDAVLLKSGVSTSVGYAPFMYNPDGESYEQVSVQLRIADGINPSTRYNPSHANALKPINISRLLAYQLACVQFYTSDAVDAIYSCDLWHQNMNALLRIMYQNEMTSFNYSRDIMINGSRLEIDSVNSRWLGQVLFKLRGATSTQFPSTQGASAENVFVGTSSATASYIAAFGYFTNIFNPQRSLKFRDYFVGSKKRPLAVGDVNVSVGDNSVNVIDITKNIQMQRFLNQVNRIGRTLKEYSRGIFNQTPMHDPHEVIYLGTTTDTIGGEETKNTGSDQFERSQSITSHLRSQSSRFAFEFDCAEFGYVISTVTFDVPRAYPDVTDRAVFHVDRFDMFNPFMQHIGDQEVLRQELKINNTGNFGYHMRYMEYKQRVDRAVGGFVEFLPGYAFLNDDKHNGASIASYGISSGFIRSIPHEFDDLYLALTNFTSAGYFHFIVRSDFEVSASRPMEAAPQIL